MDFPSLGDADVYLDLGSACAQYLTGAIDNGGSCYSDLRPIGIALYYALPFVITDDRIDANYVTLLLNLIFLMLLVYSGLVLIRRFTKSSVRLPATSLASSRPWELVFIAGTLVLSVGFLPVRLADHQSLALFLASFAILGMNGDIPAKSTAFIAGILAGCAVLFKQNYALVIAIMLASWLAVGGLHHVKERLVPIFCFALGASVSLIQIVWVYSHSGVPWLYEFSSLDQYALANQQPSVELVAYTDPFLSAYLSKLQQTVSGFEYFATKFYQGFAKFYWAVYLGKAPIDQTPELLDLSKSEMLMYEAVFIAVALASAASLIIKERWLAVLVITAFCFTTFSTAMGHVESRYFYFFRLVYLIYAVVIMRKALSWYVVRRKSLRLAEQQ